MDIQSRCDKALAAIDEHRLDAASQILAPIEQSAAREPLFRSVRAVLLVSQKSNEEALNIAVDMAKDSQLATFGRRVLENILRVLTHCCQWDTVAQVYERILSSPTASAELSLKLIWEELFMAYVRMRRFAEAHKVSVNLHRQFAANSTYAVWGSIVNLLIAMDGDPVSNALQLKLCAAVMDKQIKPSAVPSRDMMRINPQHCTLLTEAWLRLKNYTSIIDFVSSSRCCALSDADRLTQLATAHALNADFVPALALYRYLWTQNMENWTYAMAFADTLSQALTHSSYTKERLKAAYDATSLNPILSAPLPSSLPLLLPSERDACDVVDGLLASSSSRPRGLLLVQMELYQRANRDTAPLVQRYLSEKPVGPSFFLDTVKYITCQSSVEPWNWVPAPGTPALCVTPQHFNSYKLRLQLRGSVDPSVPCSDESTSRLLAEVVDVLKRCPSPTESGDSTHPWPELLVTACNIIGRRITCASTADKDSRRCWAAVGYRLTALAPPDHKFPAVHLFAILFSQLLGTGSAHAVDGLDMKSMQLDSLSCISSASLLRAHAFGDLGNYSRRAIQFYDSLDRDTGKLLVDLYRNAAWSQIQGIDQFSHALNHSVARVEWYALDAAWSVHTAENLATLNATLSNLRARRSLLTLRPEQVCCNDDLRSVAAAALHAMPGSKDQTQLLHALLHSSPTDARLVSAQKLLATLLCLHDLSIHVNRLDHRSHKGERLHAAASPPNTMDLTLDAFDIASRAADGEPLMADMVVFIKAICTTSPGDVAVEQMGASLGRFATVLTESSCWSSRAALGAAIWPALPLLTCMMRLLRPVASKHGYNIPVKPWARSLKETLKTVVMRAAEAMSAESESAVTDDEERVIVSIGLEITLGRDSLGKLLKADWSQLIEMLQRNMAELEAVVAMK